MRLIAATGNRGKLQEIRSILKDFEVLSLEDVGWVVDIPEDGDTFEANAEIKAQTVFQNTRCNYPEAWVLADDSGLVVDALGGRPGVFSARYGGEKATSAEKIKLLLSEMKGVIESDRTARFVCVAVLISPAGHVFQARGVCQGRIAFQPAGEGGFGYDPVFLTADSEFRKTMAELPEEEKNRLSHRGRALAGLMTSLKMKED